MPGVGHFATEDPAVFFEEFNDERAAILAESGLEVGLLVLGMVLLSEDQNDRGLIVKGFVGPCCVGIV